MKRQILTLCTLVILASSQFADAQTVQISTSKKEYHYGDYLEVAISVSKITENSALMYIVDSSGTKSNAIPIQIQNLTTKIISPNPFDSLIFKEGTYKIEIQYGATTSFTEFELVDAGNVVLPFGSNIVVPQWVDGTIPDYGLLKFLADKNAIKLPEDKSLKEEAKIPSWFKTNGKWWSERKISDEEFVNALNYLLSHKVIVL